MRSLSRPGVFQRNRPGSACRYCLLGLQTRIFTSENTRLTTALRRATLNYVYDFGDYWEHRIKVEKALASVP
ncbi:MAG: hypothetical protein H0W38_02320, partial [Methylibium sp.]|nr:hypothetical protein [Methylibium sp.]